MKNMSKVTIIHRVGEIEEKQIIEGRYISVTIEGGSIKYYVSEERE